MYTNDPTGGVFGRIIFVPTPRTSNYLTIQNTWATWENEKGTIASSQIAGKRFMLDYRCEKKLYLEFRVTPAPKNAFSMTTPKTASFSLSYNFSSHFFFFLCVNLEVFTKVAVHCESESFANAFSALLLYLEKSKRGPLIPGDVTGTFFMAR